MSQAKSRFYLLISSLLLLLSGLSTSSCSQNPGKTLDPELNKLVAQVVSSDEFTPDEASRFRWFDDIVVYKDEDVRVRENSLQMVQAALDKGLADRHYNFTRDSNAAHYSVLATAILGNKMHIKEIGDKFGLNTQSNTHGAPFERGTLTLFVFKETTGDILWSGAVQVFTDPDLSQDLAQQRTDKAIAALLDQLPVIQ